MEDNALPKLAPPYGEIPPTFWQQHHTCLIVAGLVFLTLVVFILKWVLHPAKPVILPPVVIARQALAQLQNQPEERQVLSAVSQILRRYAAETFNLPNGELTTTELCDSIAGNERLGAELTGVFASFLRECDVRKFSPAQVSPPLDAVGRALRLVDLAETRRLSLKQASGPNPTTSK